MTIYFAEAGGRIKIGYTKAYSAERRLHQISVSIGMKLKTIGSISGRIDFERHIFEALKQHRTGGEWFTDCPEVRSYIDRVLDGGPDAVGFKPSPKVQAQRQFVPTELTEDKYLLMWARMVAVIWPLDGIREMVAFTEYPESEVRAWLNGQKMPPRLVRYAFGALVAQFCFSKSGQTISFVDGDDGVSVADMMCGNSD